MKLAARSPGIARIGEEIRFGILVKRFCPSGPNSEAPISQKALRGNMNKQYAHQLLDRLDPSQFDAVVRLLEVMIDPQTASIRDAPIDDEPVPEEEERAVAASKDWFQKNQGISFEELVADLGLTMEQIRDRKEAYR